MTDRMLPGNAVWILRNGDILVRPPMDTRDGRYVERVPEPSRKINISEPLLPQIERRDWDREWEQLQWAAFFGRPGHVQIWVEI